MAFDWDNLFKYDTSFNPSYTQEQQQPMSPYGPQIGRNRFAELAMPEYDMNPMRRYNQYLSDEPTRDKYQPNNWQKLLYGLTGGLEAMGTGNIARGIQLTDALKDRPYEDAYKSWNTRGNKLKADVELANADYRNKSTAYDRAQQRANQERTIANTERNTDIRENEYELRLRQFENGGWEVKPSGNGRYMATRINPSTGQVETQDTNVSTNEITPQERIRQFNISEEGRNERNAASVGASRYNTDMTRKNAEMRNATDLYGIETRKYDSKKERELQERVAQMPSRSNIKDVTPPTPAEMRTAQGLVTKGFPEFNDPRLITMKGNTIDGTGITANKDEFIKVLADIGRKSGKSPQELMRRWQEFTTAAQPFAPIER